MKLLASQKYLQLYSNQVMPADTGIHRRNIAPTCKWVLVFTRLDEL
ncbi:MAG: hypothetical protein V3U78_01850 [Thiotrichaceae bacterium]